MAYDQPHAGSITLAGQSIGTRRAERFSHSSIQYSLMILQIAGIVERGHPGRTVDRHQRDGHAGKDSFGPSHQNVIGQVFTGEVFNGIGARQGHDQRDAKAGDGHGQGRAEEARQKHIDHEVVG